MMLVFRLSYFLWWLASMLKPTLQSFTLTLEDLMVAFKPHLPHIRPHSPRTKPHSPHCQQLLHPNLKYQQNQKKL